MGRYQSTTRRSRQKSWLLPEAGLIVLLLLSPHVSLAQPSNDELHKLRFELLQKDLETIKASQKALMDELQEMKKLLSTRGEARPDDRSPIRDLNTTLNVAEAFAIGDKQATLTIVEFTDYQ